MTEAQGPPQAAAHAMAATGAAGATLFFLWIARNALKSHKMDEEIPDKCKPIFLVWLGPALVSAWRDLA